MLTKYGSYFVTSPYFKLLQLFPRLKNPGIQDITILSSHNGYRFTKALTKKQKQMLSAYDAALDIVKSIKENTSTPKP
jgi:hypothetical protein